MADDDYDSMAALKKIMGRMQERTELYRSAPSASAPAEAPGEEDVARTALEPFARYVDQNDLRSRRDYENVLEVPVRDLIRAADAYMALYQEPKK